MSVLKRFSDIMASNVNALLDKLEDPAKMVDQLLLNLKDDLGKVKSETAGVMADETRAERELTECNQDVAKLQNYAELAVKAGNDDDARKFLTKKAQLAEKQATLQKGYDLAHANANKMRQMHDKLIEQINELEARRDTIKAKVAVAKTQEKINKIGASIDGSASSLSSFARMEEKANRMLDQADAMAELNQPVSDGVEDLMDKYATKTSSIDDELAKLKAGMGSN